MTHGRAIMSWACASAMLLTSASALAHHPVRASGLTTVVPQSRIDLDIEAAGFDRRGEDMADIGERGSWTTTALALELAPHPRLSFNLRTTLAWLRYADGHSASGPGDTDIGAKATIFANHDGSVAVQLGLSAELPTGDTTKELGSGHYELIPHASVQWFPAPAWLVSAYVADQVALPDAEDDAVTVASLSQQPAHSGKQPPTGPSKTDAPADDEAVHGSALAPHSDHEMHVRVMAAYRWRELYVSAGGQLTLMFESSDPLGPLLMLHEVGVLPSPKVRVSFGMDLPIAGQVRNQWVARLGGAYIF